MKLVADLQVTLVIIFVHFLDLFPDLQVLLLLLLFDESEQHPAHLIVHRFGRQLVIIYACDDVHSKDAAWRLRSPILGEEALLSNPVFHLLTQLSGSRAYREGLLRRIVVLVLVVLASVKRLTLVYVLAVEVVISLAFLHCLFNLHYLLFRHGLLQHSLELLPLRSRLFILCLLTVVWLDGAIALNNNHLLLDVPLELFKSCDLRLGFVKAHLNILVQQSSLFLLEELFLIEPIQHLAPQFVNV